MNQLLKKLNTTVILFLIIFPYISDAQDKKYIEVIASDTVMLNPVSFEYSVSIGSDNPYSMKFGNEENESPEPKTTLKDVEDVLKKNKFNYAPSMDNDYSINTTSKAKEEVVVKITSVSELERLYNSLQGLKGITGKLSDIEFEDPAKYNNTLYKGIYDNAVSQANLIASLSKNTVGALMAVEEVKEDSGNYLTDLFKSLGSITKKMPYLALFTMQDFKKAYERKLLFRFAMN